MKGAGNKLGGIRSISSRRFSIPDDDGEEDEGIGRLPAGKLGHTRMISEAEDDFVMVSVSPNRTNAKAQQLAVNKPNTRQRSRSPVPCGMTIAAEKLSLVESANQLATTSTPFKPSQPPRLPQLELDSGFDSGTFDSPLRPLPGHSRSLRSRTNDDTSNDPIEEDDNPLINRNAEPPRTAAKTFITRARSDSMRHEEGEGSSPDSVRQRQGSWIKRSKGPMPPFVDGSVPSPALGKFGQGSLFSPQRMGLSGKGRTRTNDSERSDLSSSPPPPDTPIQRSTGHQMRSSTGLSGIPQPRFTSVRRPSLGGQYATISGLPKSRSSGIGPTADADNSVFLSPASKAAASTWSSSKPIRPMDNSGRGLLSFKPERPRPHSGSALDREAELETDKEAERIFGSGKKAISMSELRHGQGGSALVLGNNVNKENQSELPVRPGRHRRTGSHHGNQLLFAKPADRSTIPGGSPFATVTNRPHRKTMSVENEHSSGMPRSFGLKAGLADTAQGPFPSALGGGYGLLPKSTSGSSRSSIDSAASTSNTNLTSITSATSLALEDPPFFDDVKPLQAAFEASDSQRVSRKFKGRDSVSSNSSKDQTLGDVIGSNMTTRSSTNALFAPQPVRPGFLKRASSYANDGDKNALYAETPGLTPTDGSGWPSAFGFDFGAARESIGGSSNSGRMAKPSMPDTPMKKGSFDGTAAGKSLARVSHSVSQPVLATQPMFSSMKPPVSGQPRTSMLPPPPKLNFKTAQQPIIKVHTTGHEMTDLPQVTITTGNLPLHARGVNADEDSPTIRLSGHFDKSLEGDSSASTGKNQLAPGGAQGVRLGLLRRLSSGAASASSEMSEDENTPTKHNGGELAMLGTERPSLIRSTTPTPAPKFGSHDDSLLAPESRPAAPSALQAPSLHHVHSAPLASRQSLPQFTLSKPVRRLNHRQSAPGPVVDHDEDVFDKRFVSLEPLGKGAFSQVFKVKERSTDKLYAVKKARGVFEGVKDR
jgi:mitosis inhibitor protein kinase SWE1